MFRGPASRAGNSRFEVVLRVHNPELVAVRYAQGRAIRGRHVIKEHGDVHSPRFWHVIIVRPCAVILMPLPDVAIEGRYGAHLVLMHEDLTV